MENKLKNSEIFTFHLVKMPLLSLLKNLISPLYKNDINGLIHSESFCIMNLGETIVSLKRYNWNSIAFFMWWRNENELEDFLQSQKGEIFTQNGWHVRMRKYRKWGDIREISHAIINKNISASQGTVVAVTLARLKLSQTLRFIKWGKPVEEQVRDHKGKNMAYAAIRPLNTFCTFSIWKNEQEMINMVNGKDNNDGKDHKKAMVERERRPFHFEFATMRFIPLSEHGTWNGKTSFLIP